MVHVELGVFMFYMRSVFKVNVSVMYSVVIV